MPNLHLANYLRRHRKQIGLSQDDIASLLGQHSGAVVSRYERFEREPTLRTALAFEVIFGTPVRELFAGLYEDVEARVEPRARALNEKLLEKRPIRDNDE